MAISELIRQSLKPAIILADNSFRPEHSRTALLCIEIGKRSLRFCIVREADKYCCWLEDYVLEVLTEESFVAELEKITKEHPLLSLSDWREVRVSVNDSDFTLVPTAWFRENYAADYLKMVLGSLDLTEFVVKNVKLNQVDSYSVFSISSRREEVLKRVYGHDNLKFIPTTSSLIVRGLMNDHREKNVLALSIEDDYLLLVVVENRKLVLCNRFRFSGHQELTYLILFTLNQLNYLPEDVKLYLYGEITPFSENYKELSQFMPNMDFGKKPDILRYCDAFEDIPDHRFNTLLTSALVVS